MADVQEPSVAGAPRGRSWSAAADLGFLAVLWVIAVVRGFDTFVVVIALLWTFRVVLFERHGYRLITRGRSWWPSKNPGEHQ